MLLYLLVVYKIFKDKYIKNNRPVCSEPQKLDKKLRDKRGLESELNRRKSF